MLRAGLHLLSMSEQDAAELLGEIEIVTFKLIEARVDPA
jgi:hypothetical protein